MSQKNHIFKEGDLVRIKPEWSNSPEEQTIIFVICKNSIDTDKQRCCICPVTGESAKLPLVPRERVGLNMIEYTGFSIIVEN